MYKAIKLWWYTASLEHQYPNVREAAAKALGKLGDARAINPLIKALANGPGVRKAAATALGQLGESKWQQCIKGDNVDWKRLGQLGDPRAVDPLNKLLRSVFCEVSCAAAEALVALRAAEPLIRALEGKESSHVRMMAAKALGQLGDARAVEPLIKGLAADADPDLRREAAKALEQLGHPQLQQSVE